jgi:AraC family transcriptional regulator
MMKLAGNTVYDHLTAAAVPLRASAAFGDGVTGALWDRDEVATARYELPTHDTLSLYVTGGEAFRRRLGDGLVHSLGAGSLCLMPRGASSQWEASGPVRMLHLYVSRRAFQRAVVETVGADPDRVTLREISYFRDPLVEAIMRQAILPLNWNEPAERVAVSHAAQTMLAYLVCRMTERDPLSLRASGGLSPAALRNVTDFIHAYIGEPLSITDLAACCRLSPYHFSRAFKQSTGETPHAFVLRRRIAHAREALTNGMSEPLHGKISRANRCYAGPVYPRP